MRDRDRLKALRVTFSRGDDRHLLKDRVPDWVWPLAIDAGLPVFVYAPLQYTELADIARRFPDLTLIVDHLGVDIDLRDEAFVDALSGLRELRDLANVALKLTCLPSLTTDEYPYPSLHPVILGAVRDFGAERVVWGSDLTRLRGTYHELVTLFTEEISGLTEPEIDLVMGQALSNLLGWPVISPDETSSSSDALTTPGAGVSLPN